MKSDIIHISSDGSGIGEALTQAEKVAEYIQLNEKDSVHLRLFTEEVMGMMKSLTGEQEADFWIETNETSYELHLVSRTQMNVKKREKLLAASSSGRNYVKGFMEKVRSAFEAALASMGEGYGDAVEMGLVEGTGVHQSYPEWTLSKYRAEAKEDEWDELEHSIVAKLADELRVRIAGSNVEMIIYKKL
ncbi:MAG: hypothetical protein K6C14_08870 [Eubacterium sp.]|nr:hypothetical protein [Eubacterium sp.]